MRAIPLSLYKEPINPLSRWDRVRMWLDVFHEAMAGKPLARLIWLARHYPRIRTTCSYVWDLRQFVNLQLDQPLFVYEDDASLSLYIIKHKKQGPFSLPTPYNAYGELTIHRLPSRSFESNLILLDETTEFLRFRPRWQSRLLFSLQRRITVNEVYETFERYRITRSRLAKLRLLIT